MKLRYYLTLFAFLVFSSAFANEGENGLAFSPFQAGISAGYGPQFAGLGGALEWNPLAFSGHNISALIGTGTLFEGPVLLYSATLRYSYGSNKDRLIVDTSYAPVYIHSTYKEINHTELHYSETEENTTPEYRCVISLGYRRSMVCGLTFFASLGLYYDDMTFDDESSSKADGLYNSNIYPTFSLGIGWQI